VKRWGLEGHNLLHLCNITLKEIFGTRPGHMKAFSVFEKDNLKKAVHLNYAVSTPKLAESPFETDISTCDKMLDNKIFN